MSNFKSKLTAILGSLLVVAVLSGCDRDADVVSRNLSQDADNFKIERRIVFYNGITNDYILTIQGLCSFDAGDRSKVAVTCKVGDGEYKKHALGLSDNVTYFSEQINSKSVSSAMYKVTFKPSVIVPVIELR